MKNFLRALLFAGLICAPAAMSSYIQTTPSGGGGGTWGSITGTLSNQTDLQSALNLKAPLASPTFTGTVALPNVTVSGSLKSGNYHIEPCFNDAGNSGTAQTIDFSTCSSQKSTLTGNVTYTFSNTVTGANYVIELSTGAGSYSTTWPGSVHWLNSGNAGPRVDTVGSNTCIVGFLYDGFTYWGNYVCTY